MSQTQKCKTEEGTLLRCYNCDYEWKYKGHLLYACCPSCRHNTNVAHAKVKDISNLAARDQSRDQIASSTALVEGGP